MKISELKNKKIAILWYWKEGKSTHDFLINLWINPKYISILDNNILPNIPLPKGKVRWGPSYLDNLNIYDIIIKSPGISLYIPEIFKVKDKIISQTEIFFNNYTWKVIWITWTKGKSTISTLTYNLLKKAWYKVKLVWNIWKPVLDEIDILSWEKYDFVVYELSSYMLEWFKPNCYIWLVNNIYPDHLDWHKNFENYKIAKENILKNSENTLIWENDYKAKDIDFEIETTLLWEHNKHNISWILKISDIIWIDRKIFLKTIKEFKPLSHRLENIWTYNWITFIDDAISTTPESTIEAIKTFWDKIWTIFLWWTDRWYNFTELINYLELYKIRNIVLFPDSWNKIWQLLDNNYTILNTNSMKKAIEFAFKHTTSWEICLLSTASPSYSLWKNYEEKGSEFKKEILEFNNN